MEALEDLNDQEQLELACRTVEGLLGATPARFMASRTDREGFDVLCDAVAEWIQADPDALSSLAGGEGLPILSEGWRRAVEHINRTGPPRALEVLPEGGFRLEVPLNDTPGPDWITCDMNSEESSTIKDPRGTQILEDQISFMSEERHVTDWIMFIDRWIKLANQEHQALLQLRQERARREALAREQADVEVQRVNEKFHDL